MKKIIVFLALLLVPSINCFALPGAGFLTIMPITGYERVQKISPTVHTTDRLFYGLRVIFGPPILSFEAEYTQSKDTEAFQDRGLFIKEDSEQGKVGLRSSFGLGPFGSWYLRAGGSARKSTVTRNEAGVVTVSEPAIRVNPYAGTGLTFRVQQNFSLNAGVTVIFSDYPEKGADEYQTSLGFSIHI